MSEIPNFNCAPVTGIEAVYLFNITLKGGISVIAALANMIYTYQVQIKCINAASLPVVCENA